MCARYECAVYKGVWQKNITEGFIMSDEKIIHGSEKHKMDQWNKYKDKHPNANYREWELKYENIMRNRRGISEHNDFYLWFKNKNSDYLIPDESIKNPLKTDESIKDPWTQNPKRRTRNKLTGELEFIWKKGTSEQKYIGRPDAINMMTGEIAEAKSGDFTLKSLNKAIIEVQEYTRYANDSIVISSDEEPFYKPSIYWKINGKWKLVWKDGLLLINPKQ